MYDGECFYKEHEKAFNALRGLVVTAKKYVQNGYTQDDYLSLAGNIRSVASSIAQCGRGDCIDQVMLLIELAFDGNKLPTGHQLDVLLDVVNKESKSVSITLTEVRSHEIELQKAGLNCTAFNLKG